MKINNSTEFNKAAASGEWGYIEDHTLMFPVHAGLPDVLPAGTPHVDILMRASDKTYESDDGIQIHKNVYYNRNTGDIYNG